MKLLSNEFEENLTTKIVEITLSTLEKVEEQKLSNRYLRADKASEYCDVSEQTIRSWVALGLPEIKVNRVTLYDTKDLDEFLLKNKT